LYDIAADPESWNNLASDPKYTDTIDGLKKWLPEVDEQYVNLDAVENR